MELTNKELAALGRKALANGFTVPDQTKTIIRITGDYPKGFGCVWGAILVGMFGSPEKAKEEFDNRPENDYCVAISMLTGVGLLGVEEINNMHEFEGKSAEEIFSWLENNPDE